jgi:hypothetical protein
MKQFLLTCAVAVLLAGCDSVGATGPLPTIQPVVTQVITPLPITSATPTVPTIGTAVATNPASPLTRASATPAMTINSNSQLGYLEGHVNIGPLVPVARADVPPPTVPPEVYASRSINIFRSDGATLVLNVKIGPDGNYRVGLAPGTYVVNLARSGIDRADELPQQISIESGKTVRLDISIDTGIR